MTVRTYKRRGGRLRPGQADALERLWPRWGVPVDGRPLDLAGLFGRIAPVVVEVGFGMGDATAEMAVARPDLDLLAVDVHGPGHGALLRRAEELGLTNVRVADGDALLLLREMLGSASVQEIRVFFPDPWPKRRHRKRRLVDAAFADLVADRLVSGGQLHLATDWPDYAEQVRDVLAAHPAYELVGEVPWRPATLFERRALRAGRSTVDVVAVRRAVAGRAG